MSKYDVNETGIATARRLIDAGKVDRDTPWSEAAPSTDEENAVIEADGYRAYGTWHLAIDTEASEETKDRYGFPFGDFHALNRAAVIHAKQRAAQNGHGAIEQAADGLLRRIDGED